MTPLSPRATTPLRAVFRFLFGHWRRRPWLVVRVGGAMVLATVTEVFVPVEAGRLIDAVASGPAGAPAARAALLAMAALGATMIALRIVALTGIVRFTVRMMADVTAEAFHRVQRLSTDWHANSFAGSTQRKITRGMWALDTLNDTLLLHGRGLRCVQPSALAAYSGLRALHLERNALRGSAAPPSSGVARSQETVTRRGSSARGRSAYCAKRCVCMISNQCTTARTLVREKRCWYARIFMAAPVAAPVQAKR